mmetsp:Transcript_13124/g.45904  ORF Transcript_13124/g.45904 Transcript_13124/m.45904 type:complete len:217 (+) Transcript_13124:536-1186(+)
MSVSTLPSSSTSHVNSGSDVSVAMSTTLSASSPPILPSRPSAPPDASRNDLTPREPPAPPSAPSALPRLPSPEPRLPSPEPLLPPVSGRRALASASALREPITSASAITLRTSELPSGPSSVADTTISASRSSAISTSPSRVRSSGSWPGSRSSQMAGIGPLKPCTSICRRWMVGVARTCAASSVAAGVTRTVTNSAHVSCSGQCRRRLSAWPYGR